VNRTLPAPFQAIDIALANRICRWFNTDDQLLWQTVAATSLALQQGHTCLSLRQCLNESPFQDMAMAGGEAFPEPSEWQAQLEQFDLSPSGESPIVLDHERVYLRRYWSFENELADFFNTRLSLKIDVDKAHLNKAKQLLNEYFPVAASDATSDIDWQRLAAINSVFGNTNLIIGGPGTGKTYTVTRVLALLANLMDHPPLIKLAAPTGKAAQRLAESIREAKQQMSLDMLIADAIPNEAMTLHRLLGVIPNQLQFRHTEDNPIEADILLIDEVSMVDLPLMARLCRAIKPSTQLILLGDADQLPSVAAGSVLSDLVIKPHPGYSAERCKRIQQLDSKTKLTPVTQSLDFVTELKHSRRFEGGSGIGVLAKQVISGEAAQTQATFNQFEDIQWINQDQLAEQLPKWISQYFKPISQSQTIADAFTQVKSFRILCATREGERGVETINETVNKRLNVNQQPFYKGQPIMVTQNHYGLRLFNGDVGLVWPNEQGQLMAWFESEDGYRAIALGRLPNVETVYAMTIHKTQGSEFSHVAMLLPDAHTAILTRELIYTGLTRAKSTFVCLGDSKVWLQGVTAQVERWAGLAERLKKHN
jgi:exodeoxyribonuclease V alpha subunit